MIHVIGLQRSGTNFVSELIRLNSDEPVTRSGDRSVCWKHALPREKNPHGYRAIDKILSTPNLTVVLVAKHPTHWVASILQRDSADLFMKRKKLIPQSGSKIPNLVRFYSNFYSRWLDALKDTNFHIVRYEDVLASSDALRGVLSVNANAPFLTAIERVPYSNPSPTCSNYLTGEHGLTDQQMETVLSLMDWRLAETIGYSKTPPVSTAKSAKSSSADIIASNKFGVYAIPASSAHRPAAAAIREGLVYEPETIEFICEHTPHLSIVHAGTYFGDFLPALSRSRIDNAKVYSFEPNSENYRCCRRTIGLNELDNVILMNAGLSAERTKLSLRIGRSDGTRHGGASSFSLHPTPDMTERSLVVTLDSAIPENERIGLIHLDVERFEQYALQGAMQIIKRDRPTIIVETLPSQEWLVERLFPIGYSRIRKLGPNTVFQSSCERSALTGL